VSGDFPYLDETEFFPFPSPDQATHEGIVGVGGNLSPGMLLSAYSQGIFPWFSRRDPILWWSPDPRCILLPHEFHLSRSMKKLLAKRPFEVTIDSRFADIIGHCSRVPRKGQLGTWITEDMIHAYVKLHELGYAHSFEVWRRSELVGGLYGVSLGSAFFGESMFSTESNASKTAVAALVAFTGARAVSIIDCQNPTPHLASLGARTVPRSRYLKLLKTALKSPTLRGSWTPTTQADPLSVFLPRRR
jgi:leucyl/phenylalanyl-tRNA--protein transferase